MVSCRVFGLRFFKKAKSAMLAEAPAKVQREVVARTPTQAYTLLNPVHLVSLQRRQQVAHRAFSPHKEKFVRVSACDLD
jgi:hypothetical protein